MCESGVKAKSELYTKRSLEELSSPDQLKDHLKVTGVPVWIVVIAILVFLAGFFVWSAFATLTSYTSEKGIVKDGVLTVRVQDTAREDEKPLASGDEMICVIGDLEAVLAVTGTDGEGNRIAVGTVPLPEGTYDVRIGYRQSRAIELLLN